MSQVSKWEEVKALAADFKRTQLSETLQRLSERNCVEIVKKLIESSLIEVIFTSDGREYITPQHLVKEIENELIANGGRIHLTDLVSILNVDYTHIESKALDLSKSSDGDISIVLGQLVNNDYKDFLANEINDRLQQSGVITVGELTKLYDLPADFLQELIESRIGLFIHCIQDEDDPKTLFTASYIDKYRAKITGVMSAVTKPVSLTHIASKYELPEKLFNSILQNLIKEGRLAGSISGSGNNRTYVPRVYSKSQNEWIENFYKQNGYLEYDALLRIGINEPKSFLTKKFENEGLLFLNSCCVGKAIAYQVESDIEECINSKSWFDFLTVLPSVLNGDDIHQLIQASLDTSKVFADSCVVLSKTVVVSKNFIDSTVELFTTVLNKKADEDLQNGKLFSAFAAEKVEKEKQIQKEATVSRKDERKKKAKGKEKSGGGLQGREVKIKSVKKKYKPSQKGAESEGSDDEESTSEAPILNFMTVEEITDFLQRKVKSLEDCPQDILVSLSKHLFNLLNCKYYDVAKAVFMSSTLPSENVKKAHSDVEKTVNSFYASIILGNKGLKLLNGDLQTQLEKHLLKTLCSDALNAVVVYASKSDTPSISTPEARQKLINKLDIKQKEAFAAASTSLNSTVDEFLTSFEKVVELCDIMLKKVDKKREKTLVSEHRQNLILQLNEAANEDAPLILLLSILLQFTSITQQVVHASGKFVPQLISFLKPQLSEQTYELLHECESLVVKQRKKELEEEQKEQINKRLNELVVKIKETILEKSVP
ncbi:E3 UFM1-protein ligase 1-like protein [Dinothrombium tinctorium]|uniref:E3 UFM1-protein ligase 1 homolog n=1 Tax=Dinothrombium tinctorium TaxID=1965070 RepID=A0A3S3PM74_9ACAR|nr:E3 UFM1-protein ligase 1-like protein [Dinothrombium tinctorium]RWS04697.1 E3 UFM1-protein ligase 1-like protein [Dinothrombium tinctorium]